MRFRHRLDQAAERLVLAQVGPDRNRPLAKALAAVGDQHRGIGAVLRAQALTHRAPAERAVEAEVVRRQLLEAPPALVARAVLAVPLDLPLRLVLVLLDLRDEHDPLAQVERRLDRVGQPRTGRAADNGAVDDDLDRVLASSAQFGRLIQADGSAVDPHPAEPRTAEFVPQGRVVLAPGPIDRRHDERADTLAQVEHLLDDLVRRLGADRDPAARAIRLA